MARRSKKPETAAEIGVTAGKIVNQYAGVETAWHPRQDRMLESEPIDNQDRLVLEGIAPMESTPTKTAARRPPGPVPLSPMGAVLLAVLFGLCGGYLDLGVIVFKKICLNPERSFRCARDFPWTVPVSHAVLLMIPGVVVGAVNRLRPKLVLARGGGVAVRNARDLVGAVENADVRRLQLGHGGGPGPADLSQGRRPGLVLVADAIDPRR